MSALAVSALGYGPVHCELLPDARMAAFAWEYMRSISGMSARVDLRMVFILRYIRKAALVDHTPKLDTKLLGCIMYRHHTSGRTAVAVVGKL